jgi:hypothetical protein
MGSTIAFAGDGKDGAEVQRKSGARNPIASYPLPFNMTGTNSKLNSAVSAGYYFVDSDDDAADYWRPDPSQFIDTTVEPATWRRIVSGPNQLPSGYWTNSSENTYGGWAYFRNPGNSADTTDNAFAGPISIGFPFYYNGVRYDSFYVSTNGLVALTNRRYFYEYDGNGYPIRRTSLEVRPGVFSVYDPMSDDLRTRTATGTDTTDSNPDNWGFVNIACGGSTTTATGGIRNPNNTFFTTNTLGINPSLNGAWSGTYANTTFPPIIAPFWDDLQVSVYNSDQSAVDDFGRVYYKRSLANDKLIVYFVNMTPRGAKTAVVGGVTHNVNFQADNRPGVGEHYRFSGQVILNRNDSSVTFQYERFFGIAPRNALQPHPAVVWVRCNSTIGITGGARRLTSYPGPPRTDLGIDNPSMNRYWQSTQYLYNVNTDPTYGGINATSNKNDDGTVPHDFLAIRFKQWKNVMRVISVYYRVRPQNPNAPLDFTVTVPTQNANNYELLAGEARLGAIQPVAIVQSLTNNITGPQGVNFVNQGVNFKVRFRIENEATGKIVYNTSKTVTDAAMRDTTLSGIVKCDYNGNAVTYTAGSFMQPYEFVRVTFPAFEPNPFIDDQIGRLLTRVIAEPKDSLNAPLGDQWPFDDTTQLRLFVMRRLTSFNDDVNEFHLVGGAAMPSVLKWVNIETDVVDGDEVTNNPPPPRTEATAANSAIFKLKSPAIRMNRLTLGNQEIPSPGNYGGDELRSFPIDLSRRKSAVLSISYQRAGKLTNIGRGFSDNRLIGPEHRVNARAINQGQPFVRKPDELLVEFARPSNDGVTNITNIPTWVCDPQNLGSKYTQPWRVWGGGGFARGYDPVNYNQQLENTFIPPTGGYREDLYDDGKDFEYGKITIPIPDTILRWVNEGARNFRFRLRTWAIANSAPPQPQDDEDNFFIDNVKILFPNEVTDVELSNIQMIWPYTMAPASQATRVPIRVKITNNTNLAAAAFSVRIQIKPEGNEAQQIYCRTITVPVLPGSRDVLLPFPDANFRQTTPGRYKVTGKIFFPGGDLDSLNDSTFTMFTMTFGPAFAYETNPTNPTNDVPKLQFSNVAGKGLNHRGYASGGSGTGWGWFSSNQYDPTSGWLYAPAGYTAEEQFGCDAGCASGQLAMRFTLYTQDTVNGYQAFWGELNSDVLNIQFSLYKDQGGLPGDERVANSTIYRRRGEDELDNTTDPVFGKYVTYLLDKPVVLPPGEYWTTVGQRGTEGYELGASETRMGMVTTAYSDIPTYGVANRSLMIDKNFRVRSRGGLLLNDNRFAYEATIGSGDWAPFTPSIGNPGYAHLDALGNSLGYFTFTRGSWIPLVRPFLGNRSFSNPPQFVDCVVPVELSFFDGKARNNGVDLFWETASEENNAGFHVERRAMKETTNLTTGATQLSCVDNSGVGDAWSSIAFVKGAGNTTATTNYRHFDATTSSNTMYEYRLRQVDYDGRESFSNVVNVVVAGDNSIALADNYPNPTSGKTTISFRVPYRTNVKIEVYDMVGNLVSTLYDQEVPGSNGMYAIEWDGMDASGREVTSGTYVYKLTAGETVESKKLTVVR